MSYYWGIDRKYYPGDTQMKAWYNGCSSLTWTGFYLAPTDNHTNTEWMSKLSTLKGQGWSCAPIYVGIQEGSSSLTSTRGATDAGEAITLATKAGFTSGTYIFLDIEQGGLLSSNFLKYINAWVKAIDSNGKYKPGIYCSYSQTADQIFNYCSILPRFWVYHLGIYGGIPFQDNPPVPSESGVPYTAAWQLIQRTNESLGGYEIDDIDLDSATSSNPAV